MPRGIPLNRDDLREHVRARWMDPSVTVTQIASEIGCHINAVSNVARRIGLPDRRNLFFGNPRDPESRRLRGREEPAREPQPEAPPSTGCPFRDAIRATGGRYDALAQVAAQHGITLLRAQQEWHRVR